jgi:hypothetical protein
MEPTTITLQHHGYEYTLHVEFDQHRAAEELLERVIRNKSRVARAVKGALKITLIAKVPYK